MIICSSRILNENSMTLLQEPVVSDVSGSYRNDLMNMLRQLLGSAPRHSSTTEISDARLREIVKEAHMKRDTVRPQTSKAEQESEERASCEDGGPCSQSNLPVMKYIPSTGAWEVVSMGNSDAIWQSLMNSAKLRDEGHSAHGHSISDSALRERIAEARRKGETDISKGNSENRPQGSSMSASMESLEQLSREERTESERQQLIRKLRSLINARLQVTSHTASHQSEAHILAPSPPKPEMTHPDVEGSAGELARRLAATLSHAESVPPADHRQIESLALALSDNTGLSQICAHPHVAHGVLGVYADSSLSSCERQLRRRIAAVQERLRGHVEHVEYSLPKNVDGGSGADAQAADHFSAPSVPPHSARAPTLESEGPPEPSAAEKALSRGLRQAGDRQRRLRAALDMQRRRMTALVQDRRGGGHSAEGAAPLGRTAAHRSGWSPPTPDEQAAAAAAKNAAAAAKKAAARGPAADAWSPPAPPGLPPGYAGPLLRDGATAVPPVPASDAGVA